MFTVQEKCCIVLIFLISSASAMFFFYIQCSANAVSSILVQTAFYKMCRARKYPYSPTEGTGISWGVGGSVRPKNLKKCMKLCWNFQRGWGWGEGLRKNPFCG